MITFFDPNSGEFRFRSEEAAQFLRALRKRHETSSKVYFNWQLTKVRPNSVGKHTCQLTFWSVTCRRIMPARHVRRKTPDQSRINGNLSNLARGLVTSMRLPRFQSGPRLASTGSYTTTPDPSQQRPPRAASGWACR
ncbi:YopT-type cysteine protease domain-containing protein [Xanthomonas axonopodis]|uniref:YopT-type cysteine protease domain-containing protein n=1 Tax=Xanthomonas axonopodis TaxID=53413 RepID=UPI001F154464|nr:YopT-type cysteine protease domain-containing protein [Xanthomonas axonopodis]